MNFVSSVNLNPCCKAMFEADEKLLNKSNPGTKKTCPECKCVNVLVAGTWSRPLADNPQFNRFPIDEEKAKQGLTNMDDPAVAAFEAKEAKAEAKTAPKVVDPEAP